MEGVHRKRVCHFNDYLKECKDESSHAKNDDLRQMSILLEFLHEHALCIDFGMLNPDLDGADHCLPNIPQGREGRIYYLHRTYCNDRIFCASGHGMSVNGSILCLLLYSRELGMGEIIGGFGFLDGHLSHISSMSSQPTGGKRHACDRSTGTNKLVANCSLDHCVCCFSSNLLLVKFSIKNQTKICPKCGRPFSNRKNGVSGIWKEIIYCSDRCRAKKRIVKKAVWWMKRDFRITDNQCLFEAVQIAEAVLPSFAGSI